MMNTRLIQCLDSNIFTLDSNHRHSYSQNIFITSQKKRKKKIMIIHQDLLDRCEAGNRPIRYFSL
jgi:hypothetical protein